jgi:hypothetical protein
MTIFFFFPIYLCDVESGFLFGVSITTSSHSLSTVSESPHVDRESPVLHLPDSLTDTAIHLGRTNRLFSFTMTWTAQKTQQFSYSFVPMRCRGNVLTEPLHSNDG